MHNKTQLFLLHFAGGNSYSFQFLKSFINKDIEFQAIELPGRGKRMGEQLIKTEREAVDDLLIQIRAKRNNLPFIIYGHSMGALLGFHLTAELEKCSDAPSFLIVSGNAGPRTGIKKDRYLMDDFCLKEELRRMGGVPEEVLNNEDLFNFFLPVMKADFEIIENVKLTPEKHEKINTPIFAVMGTEEETIEDISNWGNYTSAYLKELVLEGNHFFIHKHPAKIAAVINDCYDRTLVHGY